MPKVLMLCYYYPPLGGIGSQRSQKFARYLPHYGWRPIVVTPTHGSYFMDASLDTGESQGVEVLRTATVDLSRRLKAAARALRLTENTGAEAHDVRPMASDFILDILKHAVRTWLYIPDGQIGWLPYALYTGRRRLQRQDIDVIYSTSFPITAHLVAYMLKRLTGKPWVADFRDLWTENHYAAYSSPLRKRLDQWIESALLQNADALITVSNVWAETLRNLAPGKKRVVTIRNGFDSAEFAELQCCLPTKWTLTYVGLFYGVKQNPSPVLAALRDLIDTGQIHKQDIEFRIVGVADHYVQGLVERYGLTEQTAITGFVSHRESLAHQINSSLLLLFFDDDRRGQGLIPGKLYEYLGARRPILAIIPRDFEAAGLIRCSNAGVTAEAGDKERIEQCLLNSYTGFKRGLPRHSGHDDLSMYERKYETKQLAELLDDLSA